VLHAIAFEVRDRAIIEFDRAIDDQDPLRALEGFKPARQRAEIRRDAIDLLQVVSPGAEIVGVKIRRNGVMGGRRRQIVLRRCAARSTLLAYLFNKILSFSSSPFDFKLPSSVALFTRLGMIFARSPLPSCKPRTLKRPSDFRSPSGLASHPDRSAQSADRSEKLTFVPGPMTLYSPNALISLIN